MTPEAWGFLGVLVTAFLGSGTAVAVAFIQARRHMDRLETKTDKAVEQTVKTGNGFADDVRSALVQIQQANQRQSADIADLKTSTSDLKETASYLTGRLDQHMKDHQGA